MKSSMTENVTNWDDYHPCEITSDLSKTNYKQMKTTNKLLATALITSITLGGISCKSSNAVKGGAIGGAAGGALGGVIAGKGNTAVGVLIGSAIGGSAGAIIGNQMDKAADELERDLEGAEVERVGEGIKITFDSGLMFPVDKSELRAYSVEDFLTSNGIAKNRMEITAYGEMQPTATNDTEEGRQQNRRVEVAIYANKKMQKMAERGELGKD